MQAKEGRTTSELRVPSSTTCVETMALPSNAQNNPATTPAWRAVRATSAVDPCCSTAPVVRSWNGKEMKYMIKKIRNSERPARGHVERPGAAKREETHRQRPSFEW